jgi:hypothetical protein
MTRYLTIEEVLYLHRLVLEQSGGSGGIRDSDGLESALAQPRMTFGGHELHPQIAERQQRSAILWYAIIHSLMETSAPDTPRWRRSWYSTAGSWMSVSMSKKP